MSLKYLLDTNVCIYIAKQKPASVLDRFSELEVGEVALSIISYGELIYGAEKSQHKLKALRTLEELIGLIPALPMPIDAGKHYGHVRSYLEKKGKIIGNNDLWIAAHALSLKVILVTNNVKEFNRVPKLKIDNWC